MAKLRNLWRGSTYVMTSFLVLTAGISGILEANRTMVDTYFDTQSSTIVGEEVEGEALFSTYQPDYETSDSLVARHKELVELVQEEGSVLLKNKDNALPIAKSSPRVTLFGLRSESTIGIGTVGLKQGLEERGFQVNETMAEAYKTLAADSRFSDSGRGSSVNKLPTSYYPIDTESKVVLAEPTLSDIESVKPDYASSVSDYNDLGIVVIGRPWTEGGDYFPGSVGIDQSCGANNPLSLTNDERAIIDYAKESCDKVVVLLNTNNPIELEELENDNDVDAIMWIGNPGGYGAYGIADLLKGAANPSGKLIDTYAVDSVSSPAMQNFGVNKWSNGATAAIDGAASGNYFLAEAEGIYTGYKYYETRYEDTVLRRGNAASAKGAFASQDGWSYAEEVTYSFGYGLSYSTFEQTLDKVVVSADAKTATVTVTVENLSDIPGKDVVQIYAQAPYIEGGVEKSAVQLLDYVKTETLVKGKPQTYEIEVDLQNLASYDYKDAQTYILDFGDYYFSVGNGAHEALNSILAAKGKTVADGMDTVGNADQAKVWHYTGNGVDDYTFALSKTNTKVGNALQDADYNNWKANSVTYLSRADWDSTWPVSYNGKLEATTEMIPYLNNNFYELKTNDDVSDIQWNASGNLKFSEMKGADYDDPRWEELLNQLDLQDVVRFIGKGNYNYQSLPAIGFSGGQMAADGTRGFGGTLYANANTAAPWIREDDPNASFGTGDMCSSEIVAATFSPEILNAIGNLWGNDSLYNGLPLLFAPAMNLHRTPYGGRNGDYYSEDPVVSGISAREICKGAQEKGLIVVIKHFAFNDQESNREGVCVFMNEQKARESELRAFQIAFEGGVIGTMTAYNRIGPVWVGAHKGLLQTILRDEWGFNGYTVTDMAGNGSYMTYKEGVIAGTTNFLALGNQFQWDNLGYVTENTNSFGGDAEMQEAMKLSTKRALYTFANSNLMNSINSTTREVWLMTWWRAVYISLIVLFSFLTLGSATLYALTYVSKGKSKEVES